MVSPIVICDGVFRSGSTWSFNVCRLLGQRLADRRGESFRSCYLNDQQLDQFLQTEVFLRQGPGVFKGHIIGPVAAEWIRTGRAKAICTFRDPRDCVASDMAFMGLGFDKSVARLIGSLKCLETYQDFGRTLFIRYEEMMSDRPAQIRRIAAHLNIRIEEKDIESIDEQTNIQTSRKQCEEIGNLGEAETAIVAGNHRRHLITLLHENHIGTGKIGKWKQDLTADQGQRLTQMFARVLVILGYETEESIQLYLATGSDASIDGGAASPDTGSANAHFQ